jgi:hypothetical protein
MKNQAEVHALLLKIAAAVEELATVIGADDVPDDWEARGEPNPYVFDPNSAKRDFVAPRSWGEASVIFATGNKPEDGASQTARGLVHSMPWDVCKPDAEEWMEAVDALIPTAEAWMEAAAAQGKYEPRDAKSIMLDEWLDFDTRAQSIQAAKALHPLLEAKTPRNNNNKR